MITDKMREIFLFFIMFDKFCSDSMSMKLSLSNILLKKLKKSPNFRTYSFEDFRYDPYL